MQNIEELRQSLLENYENMKSKKMDLATGKQLANTAGKIISSVKVELEYCKMKGEKPDIDFLKKGKKK